ncbi:MAG: FtsQ-type POTRA domain-containing protein [Puniceicoccales bacterium]|jgi:cell division septal protein FtsQ|nr:FtsQ-type POTRA domain-containing protein [Puniceicoccales bacterium]
MKKVQRAKGTDKTATAKPAATKLAKSSEQGEARAKRKKVGGFARVILTLFAALAIAIAVGRGVRIGYHRVRSHIAVAHRLRTVHIVGNRALAKDTIVRLLKLPRQISLEEIDVRLCRRRLLACPQIAAAQVERSYPDDLRLRIVERVPVLRLPPLDDGETLLVAADGMVFVALDPPPANWQDLPLLRGMAGAVVGRTLAGVAELCQALRAAAEIDGQLVASWRVITVEPGMENFLDCFEVQCPDVQHLRLRMDNLPQQLEELGYILADWRKKKLLPLSRVDLTIPGKAYVKPGHFFGKIGN